MVSVAIDVLPLIGSPTGVGALTHETVDALQKYCGSQLELSAFAVTWRRSDSVARTLPPAVKLCNRLPMPARLLHLAWRYGDWPPLEIWTGKVDVVHATNFVAPPTRSSQAVMTIHDLTPWRYPELCTEHTRVMYPLLVKRALERGAWVHTTTQFVADEVGEFLGVGPDRIRVIRPGIPRANADESVTDETLVSPHAKMSVVRNLVGTRPYILALGTVEPRKDLPTLARAFDIVAADHPDLQLVIAGADGWGSDDLNAAIAQMKFGNRVRRLGYLDPSARTEVLKAARVFAYPSIYEGFGFPPLEAMRTGVPVVATTAGALPEVIGDAAILVKPGDVAALADALGSVVSDDGVSEQLVAKGRAHVATFGWEQYATDMASLYADLAQSSPPARKGRVRTR